MDDVFGWDFSRLISDDYYRRDGQQGELTVYILDEMVDTVNEAKRAGENFDAQSTFKKYMKIFTLLYPRVSHNFIQDHLHATAGTKKCDQAFYRIVGLHSYGKIRHNITELLKSPLNEGIVSNDNDDDDGDAKGTRNNDEYQCRQWSVYGYRLTDNELILQTKPWAADPRHLLTYPDEWLYCLIRRNRAFEDYMNNSRSGCGGSGGRSNDSSMGKFKSNLFTRINKDEQKYKQLRANIARENYNTKLTRREANFHTDEIFEGHDEFSPDAYSDCSSSSSSSSECDEDENDYNEGGGGGDDDDRQDEEEFPQDSSDSGDEIDKPDEVKKKNDYTERGAADKFVKYKKSKRSKLASSYFERTVTIGGGSDGDGAIVNTPVWFHSYECRDPATARLMSEIFGDVCTNNAVPLNSTSHNLNSYNICEFVKFLKSLVDMFSHTALIPINDNITFAAFNEFKRQFIVQLQSGIVYSNYPLSKSHYYDAAARVTVTTYPLLVMSHKWNWETFTERIVRTISMNCTGSGSCGDDDNDSGGGGSLPIYKFRIVRKETLSLIFNGGKKIIIILARPTIYFVKEVGFANVEEARQLRRMILATVNEHKSHKETVADVFDSGKNRNRRRLKDRDVKLLLYSIRFNFDDPMQEIQLRNMYTPSLYPRADKTFFEQYAKNLANKPTFCKRIDTIRRLICSYSTQPKIVDLLTSRDDGGRFIHTCAQNVKSGSSTSCYQFVKTSVVSNDASIKFVLREQCPYLFSFLGIDDFHETTATTTTTAAIDDHYNCNNTNLSSNAGGSILKKRKAESSSRCETETAKRMKTMCEVEEVLGFDLLTFTFTEPRTYKMIFRWDTESIFLDVVATEKCNRRSAPFKTAEDVYAYFDVVVCVFIKQHYKASFIKRKIMRTKLKQSSTISTKSQSAIESNANSKLEQELHDKGIFPSVRFLKRQSFRIPMNSKIAQDAVIFSTKMNSCSSADADDNVAAAASSRRVHDSNVCPLEYLKCHINNGLSHSSLTRLFVELYANAAPTATTNVCLIFQIMKTSFNSALYGATNVYIESGPKRIRNVFEQSSIVYENNTVVWNIDCGGFQIIVTSEPRVFYEKCVILEHTQRTMSTDIMLVSCKLYVALFYYMARLAEKRNLNPWLQIERFASLISQFVLDHIDGENQSMLVQFLINAANNGLIYVGSMNHYDIPPIRLCSGDGDEDDDDKGQRRKKNDPCVSERTEYTQNAFLFLHCRSLLKEASKTNAALEKTITDRYSCACWNSLKITSRNVFKQMLLYNMGMLQRVRERVLNAVNTKDDSHGGRNALALKGIHLQEATNLLSEYASRYPMVKKILTRDYDEFCLILIKKINEYFLELYNRRDSGAAVRHSPDGYKCQMLKLVNNLEKILNINDLQHHCYIDSTGTLKPFEDCLKRKKYAHNAKYHLDGNVVLFKSAQLPYPEYI